MKRNKPRKLCSKTILVASKTNRKQDQVVVSKMLQCQKKPSEDSASRIQLLAKDNAVYSFMDYLLILYFEKKKKGLLLIG